MYNVMFVQFGMNKSFTLIRCLDVGTLIFPMHAHTHIITHVRAREHTHTDTSTHAHALVHAHVHTKAHAYAHTQA